MVLVPLTVRCNINCRSQVKRSPECFGARVFVEQVFYNRHGEEEEAASHRRNGSEDPGLSRAEVTAAGFPEVRPGLRDDEAASLREDAASDGLAGRPQGEPPLLSTGWSETVRNWPNVHPKVLAGGPHGAQLLGDHQGQGGLHS